MLHRFKGSGLPNVYLEGGLTVTGESDEQATAYSDLDGLYKAIARAIANRTGQLSGQELRFLRKRLGMSQADVGALGGKTEQAAAKWEKGTLPVPKAEANLLRLSALSKFGTRVDLSRAVKHLPSESMSPDYPYVIRLSASGWTHDDRLAVKFAQDQAALETRKALKSAIISSQIEVKYTSSLPQATIDLPPIDLTIERMT